MGQLIKNKTLNYWVCGLIFVILFPLVLGAIQVVTAIAGALAGILGFIVYIIIMPYVVGRFVDYISDKWMD
ncbi:hypothetical protein ACFLRC_03370 [Candidatus Altiarchaeota archaeon]